MQFFDKKFISNKKRYLLQCILATACVFIVLLILDTMANAAVIAALGASSFIAFTMPHTEQSRPRYMIGGYVVGILSACFCYYLSIIPTIKQIAFISDHTLVIFSSIAVGLSIFLMVITDTEHPPAASIALGLVFNKCNYMSITVVLIGIITLSLLKFFLKPLLKNLL